MTGIEISEENGIPMKSLEEITARRDLVQESIRTCRNSLFLPDLRKELETLNWIIGEGLLSNRGIRSKDGIPLKN